MIIASSYHISKGVEEVRVLKSDCPIKRTEGLRFVSPTNERPARIECTCSQYNEGGLQTPPCSHYGGVIPIADSWDYKVNCKRIKENPPHM
jgi:hypothetical protein